VEEFGFAECEKEGIVELKILWTVEDFAFVEKLNGLVDMAVTAIRFD
jgi:hypothetical protein